jgi:hypothetical protein
MGVGAGAWVAAAPQRRPAHARAAARRAAARQDWQRCVKQTGAPF